MSSQPTLRLLGGTEEVTGGKVGPREAVTVRLWILKGTYLSSAPDMN